LIILKMKYKEGGFNSPSFVSGNSKIWIKSS